MSQMETPRNNDGVFVASISISIDSDVTSEQINVFLGQLEYGHNIPLKMAIKLSQGGNEGLTGELNQLVITWARMARKSILYTYVPKEEADSSPQFARMCDKVYFITALTMADEIYCSDGVTRIFKKIALSPAKERIQSINEGKFSLSIRGHSIDLICIVNSKTANYIMPFYRRENELRSRNEIENVVEEVLVPLFRTDTQRSELKPKIIRLLADVFYELLENTHEHSLCDIDNSTYLNGARGAIFKYTPIYGQRNDKKDWIEITVFDSGPGISRRFLAEKKPTFEKQCSTLRECFLTNKTSKNEPHSGSGLPRAMRDVKELKGRIFLRDGCVEMVYDSESEEFVFKERHPVLGAMVGISIEVEN